MYAPADVPSGLACNCVCVGCGAALVAKKGRKNRWHFAHHAVEIGESCAESAIHASAKQVLLERNWLQVPEVRVVVSSYSDAGHMLQESSVLSVERAIRFERSRAEVWETNIRPDVVGYRGERRLLVEMYFRHKVDANKRTKLASLQQPAVEIDLADLDVSAGFEAVEQRVLHETAFKTWLYFPGEENEQRRLRKQLADRIRQANAEHRAEEAAKQARMEKRQRKLEEERVRREAAAQRYRQLPSEKKERDLRERLGITGRWPYYLRKVSEGGGSVDEKPMIWQGALFARFVFGKENKNYELKQEVVLKWVLKRFGIGSSSIGAVNLEIRRYLGYLSACGFLKKLPYNPYESQGYIVVHGHLHPPAKFEKPPDTQLQLSQASAGQCGHQPAEQVDSTIPETPAKVTPAQWIWRASWPKWNDIADQAASLVAASEYGEYLEALLHGISQFSRPDDPLECANILAEWGVPQNEVMSMLQNLGLVLKRKGSA